MEFCDSGPETIPENDYLLIQDFYMKGDDVQKLSVIQALPQLLQYDSNGTITRLLPKIQQELPKSSCEFHIATSKIFKVLIEKRLPLNLIVTVFQGSDSKDPIVSHAWMDTLLAVIPILTLEQVKNEVLPVALAKGQPSNPVFHRINCCRILGKVAVHPKIPAADVKTIILPLVQTLCQDVNPDVRAAMCGQLNFIAQGLGETLIKSSLLPSLVELAADNNMNVRSAAVAAVVLMVPHLTKQTRTETIIPLIKQLCSKSAAEGDTTFPTISREFGRLIDALQNDLDNADCIWFLNFYKLLSKKGYASQKDNIDPTQAVLCREQCAFNLPAVTFFVTNKIPAQIELWRLTFSDLSNDPCYLVRKTVAGCVHEVTRILGPQCKIIRQDVVKLLRDDAEEVLLMLVPHLGLTLEYFCAYGVLSRDQTFQSTLEIARALLKCLVELSKGHNWRIKACFLQQLERLPSCMSSDFIHQHFTPVLMNYALEPRSKPVKIQATRTLLVFLRHNAKEIQRKWIRDNLTQNLRYSKSCYTRHIFVRMCACALEIFSGEYFKKFFFEPLLGLTEDPISNVRLSVVMLIPLLSRILNLPEDKKLQTVLDSAISKLDMYERNKDVKDILKAKMKEMRSLNPKVKADLVIEERRKVEEENKIAQGKFVFSSPVVGDTVKSAPAPPTAVAPPAVRSSAQQLPTQQSSSQSLSRSPSVQSRTGPSSTTIKSSSSATAPGSAAASENMSFLEHHFYVDAGVSLPCGKINEVVSNKARDMYISKQLTCKMLLTAEKKNSITDVPTVSVENVDVDRLTENDVKILETATSNITDDVKVNLQKICKRNSITAKTIASTVRENASRIKRHSSILSCSEMNSIERSYVQTTNNRRSLNLTVGDSSRIPVCLNKSKSNNDVKSAREPPKMMVHSRKYALDVVEKNAPPGSASRLKVRPKSEIYLSSSREKVMDFSRANFSRNNCDTIGASMKNKTGRLQEDLFISSSIKSNVPMKCIIKENVSKASALPVLKRRVHEPRK